MGGTIDEKTTILLNKDFEVLGFLIDTKEYGGIDFRIKEPSVKANREPSYIRYYKEIKDNSFIIEYDAETNIINLSKLHYSTADGGEWIRLNCGIDGLIIKDKSDLPYLLERSPLYSQSIINT